MNIQQLTNDYKEFTQQGGYFLLDHQLIQFTGEKAASLLHGQVTNDVKNLQTGYGNYNLLLSIKGKVTADFFIFREDDFFNLLISTTDAQQVVDHFNKLAPLSRVELKTLPIKILHLIPQKNQLKELTTLEKHELKSFLSKDTTLKAFRSDRFGLKGYDIFFASEQQNSLLQECDQKNFIQLHANLVDCLRIEQGIPQAHLDFNESNLPQEACLDHALHFEKGCYLGQEIIARLHYKGHVNKLLKRLVLSGEDDFKPDELINKAGKKIGAITSITYSPNQEQYLALGYIPYKQQEKGTTFQTKNQNYTATLID